MARPIAPSGIKRGRGNPNWSKPHKPLPVLPTEFEEQVERLQLTRAEYVTSNELRRWCERNRNRCYVPEWLLSAWGLTVEEIFGDVA